MFRPYISCPKRSKDSSRNRSPYVSQPSNLTNELLMNGRDSLQEFTRSGREGSESEITRSTLTRSTFFRRSTDTMYSMYSGP